MSFPRTRPAAAENSPLLSKRWKRTLTMIVRNKVLYLFILPAILYYIIFNYLPMYGIQIAFKDYMPKLGITGSPWLDPWYENFTTFFSSVNFWTYMKNTLRLSLYSLLIGFPVPIILALLVNEVKNTKFKKFVQNITYLPYFISTVVLVGMLNLIFAYAGPINQVIMKFGGEPILFLTKAELFPHLYVWSGLWTSMGYSAVIYISALSGVSPDLHEAAILDGASRLQRIRYVNIPAILPTITIMFLLALGGVMSVGYEKAYLMQNALNTEYSEILSTYVYKVGLQGGRFGFSAAVGLFNNIINLILLVSANFLSRKVGETSLW